MSRAWMPLYVADYLADTGHLGTLEHGAYLLLIMHYWQKGELPDDDKQLARIVRLALPEWLEIRSSIASLFYDGWKHRRVESELAVAKEKYDKRAKAGRMGGKAKHAASHNMSSNAIAMSEQCSTNHNHNHKKENKEKNSVLKKEGAGMTFVAKDTPEWEAWQSAKKMHHQPVWSGKHRAMGWWFPSRFPQQQEAAA